MKEKVSAFGCTFFMSALILLMVCMACAVVGFKSAAFVFACMGIPLMVLSLLVLLASLCMQDDEPSESDKCKCGEYKYECKCYEDFFK